MKTITFLALSILITDMAAANENSDSVFTDFATRRNLVAPSPFPVPKLKSPEAATWIAIGNTAIPIIAGLWMQDQYGFGGSNNETLFKIGGVAWVYGISVGPSMGNFYAGDFKRGSIGILGRAVGAALMLAGAHSAFSEGGSDGTIPFLSGLAIGGVSTLYNCFSASTSAREYNARHSVSLVPSYNPFNKTASLSIGVHF